MNNIRRSMETLLPMIYAPRLELSAGLTSTIVASHVCCPVFGKIMLWGFNAKEIILYRGGPIQKTDSITHCWVADTDLA